MILVAVPEVLLVVAVKLVVLLVAVVEMMMDFVEGA